MPLLPKKPTIKKIKDWLKSRQHQFELVSNGKRVRIFNGNSILSFGTRYTAYGYTNETFASIIGYNANMVHLRFQIISGNGMIVSQGEIEAKKIVRFKNSDALIIWQ